MSSHWAPRFLTALRLPQGGSRRARPGFLRFCARLSVRLVLFCCAVLGALWVLVPYPASRVDQFPAGAIVLDRERRPLRVFASSRGEFRLPISLREMSPWIVQATLAVEDRHFRFHPGVNPFAIARAALQNAARGRVHSGASTLTQQLVRMLDERPRTLWSKAVEAFRALQLEAQLSKDRLLEAYLNLAPYGGNLRGVEAASLRYFGKRAMDLDLSEASLLAGLPQSPSRLRPDRHLDRALKRRRTVLGAMVRAGYISAEERYRAERDVPAIQSHPWPFEAPHFAKLARDRAGSRGGAIVTTLDRETQRTCESWLSEYFTGPERAQLSGAAVVIEAASGAVRALVGSPDYFDAARRGALNGAVRARSPGSALKPFLYALGFEKGLVAPQACLWDVPMLATRYSPENYDRSYRGPVRAEDALSLSLNVPAVAILKAVGTHAFLDLLLRAGLKTLDRPAEHYGLQLALGGCEVTLLDLTAAYACLLRLGVPCRAALLEEELRGTRGGAPTSGARSEDPILSPGACQLVLECLSSERHLARANSPRPSGAGGLLGYKTGTSFGHRDAWAIAFTSRHAVGVWIGDPRGKHHPELIGAEAALPVALSIAASLEKAGDPLPWEDPHARWVKVDWVCSVSGFPAGLACPQKTLGRFPAGAPIPPPCSVHREICVDRTAGFEVCPGCRRGRDVVKKVVEVWPPEVEAWLVRSNLRSPDRPLIPPHDPACRFAGAGPGPKIVSPLPGTVFRRSPDAAGRIHLLATVGPGTSRLHWFVDGELVGVSSPSEGLPWTLRPGAHDIRCVDDRGRSSLARFEVR